LLESCAKEYPAGLIADDGRARASLRPKEEHIGPIDPEACTLNQFLKSLAIRATADVLVDGGDVWSRSLPTAAPNASAGPKAPAPDSRRGGPGACRWICGPTLSVIAHAQAECAGG
jgi:hypothetical protein